MQKLTNESDQSHLFTKESREEKGLEVNLFKYENLLKGNNPNLKLLSQYSDSDGEDERSEQTSQDLLEIKQKGGYLPKINKELIMEYEKKLLKPQITFTIEFENSFPEKLRNAKKIDQ